MGDVMRDELDVWDEMARAADRPGPPDRDFDPGPDYPPGWLCPEAEMRARMPDDEFWEHVLLGGPDEDRYEYDPDEDPNLPTSEELVVSGLCPVCGSETACGTDEQGRPWIHAVPVDDDGEGS